MKLGDGQLLQIGQIEIALLDPLVLRMSGLLLRQFGFSRLVHALGFGIQLFCGCLHGRGRAGFRISLSLRLFLQLGDNVRSFLDRLLLRALAFLSRALCSFSHHCSFFVRGTVSMPLLELVPANSGHHRHSTAE
jgi:hypothetical protein